uniref:ATP synthase F0 subunit 8 n=1 Tax=Agrilus zanthoxylumi TaxID=2696312 RepID=UPI00286B14D2|nr:ATP synthase F0 subunit 8 [Agrilus zanthoxylumi]WKF51808.1 ATP synthase F0 subunit 8 [Agrilus zanthoxylumi]
MPQMAPMSWLILFLIFSLMLLIFNMLNYYNFNYSPMKTSFKNFKKKINWKW